MKRQIRLILTAIFMFVAVAVTAQDNFYEELVDKGYDIIIIENKGVKEYYEDRSYDDPKRTSDYNHSIVKKYSTGSSSRPAGIMLNWYSSTPVNDISKVIVTLVESDIEMDESILDEDLTNENVKYYYPNTNKKEYLLCNMCPDKYCYYKIEEVLHNGQRTIVDSGRFYTYGKIRMLRVDGMVNVRDFGGWYTSFDKEVVYGRLFRGNRPKGITPTGKNDFVKNEHITADLDLRGITTFTESPLGPEVEFFSTDNQRYKIALTGRTQVFVKDLDFIASVLRRGGNVFLHCNHGTNRAGTLSFLIEGILGLNEADLSREYELSSFAYGISRSPKFGDMFPVIRSYGEANDDLAQCFYNYARSIGVSEKTLDTIRCVMLGLSPNDTRILDAHRR